MKKIRITRGKIPSFGNKCIRIMKLTLLFLTIGLLQVSGSVYSQNTKLTLKVRDSKVSEILDAIENQSEFRFAYSPGYIDLERILSVDVKEKTLEQCLQIIFNETDVKYEILDRHILLFPDAMDRGSGNMVAHSHFEISQQRTVSGKVTDQVDQPLPGVSIIVKGTIQGTVSNADGEYSLSNIPDNAILVFSFVGMRTQELEVGDQTSLNVKMEEETIGLEEVVAIGYGTMKKANLTGSVAAVSGEEIENRSLPNVGEVLRGVSPNLNINLTGYGGEPGSSRSWNIRGIGSITGNYSPLILVDGVETNINQLDPQDIESVSILKDASASAIYGSRAPFGVVLITTKTGTEGEIHLEYNNNLSFDRLLGVSHMYNSVIYATALNQVAANSGSAPVFSDTQIERMKEFMAGTLKEEYDPNRPAHSIWQTRQTGNANYDWPYEYLKNFKFDQAHNVNIRGGDERNKYYISLGYYDEDGFYAVGYDDYRRYNALANFTTKITDWLKADFNTKYANSHTDHPLGITTVERRYFWTNFYIFGPNVAKYNLDGSYSNPMYRSIESSGRDITNTNDFLISLKTELEPIKDWKTNISFNYNFIGRNTTVNPKPIPVVLQDGNIGNVGKPNTAYEDNFDNSTYALFNVVTSYEKNMGNHYFKALAGYEQEKKFYTWLYARGDNLITEEVPSISTSLGTKTVDDTKWEWATQGIFGRLNYNYKEKYLLEFSARYNGSSRFAPKIRWGFFPSGSAGYQISKENFWQPIESYINNLKIRASYGSLGNQNVANYLYIPVINVVNETPYIIGGERPVYAQTPGILGADLTWETITTLNFGIDAGFLKNRLTLSFDQFIRKTSNMFGPQGTLPYTLGTGTPKANNAEMETKGFELILGWKDRLSNDFTYDVQFNLGDYHSTILKYKNDNGIISDWYVGKQVGEIWGYVTEGIIQTQAQADQMPDQTAIYPNWGPGDIQYKDINGDGKITSGAGTLTDHGDKKIIGNSTPRYNIGISGGFNWKSIDFNMQWMGLGRHDWFPPVYSGTFWGLSYTYLNTAILKGSPVLDYWRPADETNMLGPNTDAYLPKPYGNNNALRKNRETQSKYLLNAAYLRLKHVQLGYTLPSSITKLIFIQTARVFITGENLITIQNIPRSIDPEQAIDISGSYTSQGAYYPMAKTVSIGVNLTF